MRGTIPPRPQYVFIAWCLVKHRDNFNFTLLYTNVIFKGTSTLGVYSLTVAMLWGTFERTSFVVLEHQTNSDQQCQCFK
jgi:hypothetical protein